MALLETVERWCSLIVLLPLLFDCLIEWHSHKHKKCKEQCLVSNSSNAVYAKISNFLDWYFSVFSCVRPTVLHYLSSQVFISLFACFLCFSACGYFGRWTKFCDFASRFAAVLVNSSKIFLTSFCSCVVIGNCLQVVYATGHMK